MAYSIRGDIKAFRSPQSYPYFLALQKPVRQLIAEAAKPELHLHTSGSISPEFIVRMGRNIDWHDPMYPDYPKLMLISENYGLDIPTAVKTGDTEALRKFLEFDGGTGGLPDYLNRMSLGHRLLHNNLDAWQELAYDIALRCRIESNVSSLELRFPVIKPPLRPEEIIKAVHQGLLRAERDVSGLKTGMIVCAMKPFAPEITEGIVDSMIELRKDPAMRSHLIGLDTAGPEIFKGPDGKLVKFDHDKVRSAFTRARMDGIKIVNHAGEQFFSLEDGLDAIRKSVELLGAKRIGHALAIGIRPDELLGKQDLNRREYDRERIYRLQEAQRDLLRMLIDREVMVEACLSSNLQTQPGLIPDLNAHPLGRWLNQGLKVTLASDNYVTSGTSLTVEYLNAALAFDLRTKQIERMIEHGFEG
ncbi:MAG TPA: hypothetical protein VMD02_04335 [Candidatus Omnitrophota bacterium]|nr:hypothetical protein [Candidatus Omnitrophota bacterium]